MKEVNLRAKQRWPGVSLLIFLLVTFFTLSFLLIYLIQLLLYIANVKQHVTVIPEVHVEYKMMDSQQGMQH